MQSLQYSEALCVSTDDEVEGGEKAEVEKRRMGKMCLFHTSYCPRRLPFHCLSQSRPLSFSGSTATPVVQYLTSRPALFRGFCATREERRLHSRERERSLHPRLHTLLFFGYLAKSGLTPFRILTKIVTSYFAFPSLHIYTQYIYIYIAHRRINLRVLKNYQTLYCSLFQT